MLCTSIRNGKQNTTPHVKININKNLITTAVTHVCPCVCRAWRIEAKTDICCQTPRRIEMENMVKKTVWHSYFTSLHNSSASIRNTAVMNTAVSKAQLWTLNFGTQHSSISEILQEISWPRTSLLLFLKLKLSQMSLITNALGWIEHQAKGNHLHPFWLLLENGFYNCGSQSHTTVWCLKQMNIPLLRNFFREQDTSMDLAGKHQKRLQQTSLCISNAGSNTSRCRCRGAT